MENSEFINLFGESDKDSHNRLIAKTLYQLDRGAVPPEAHLEFLEVRTSLANLYRRYNKIYTLGWQDACKEMTDLSFLHRPVFVFSHLTAKNMDEIAAELRRSLMIRNNKNVRTLWFPGEAPQ